MGDRARLRWHGRWLALGWLWVLVIIWLSLTPRPPQIDIEQGDKIGHVAAFALLMLWFCQIYASRRARIGYALGFVALGIAIEFAQRETGYRSFEVADMVADAMGVALGWIAARYAGELLRRVEDLFAMRS